MGYGGGKLLRSKEIVKIHEWDQMIDVNIKGTVNVIRHLLSSLDYKGRDDRLLRPDPSIVFTFSEKALSQDLLAH